MSSITELQQELIGGYINQSAEVLFLYDSVVTICQEVDLIWRRRWTATTWLYALTRYTTIIGQVVLFIPPGNFVSCTIIMRIDQVLMLIQYLCLACFSALRVYALLDGKYLIAGIVLLLNLVPFATNMFSYVTSVVLNDAEACKAVPQSSNNLLLILPLTTRISVIIGDVLVLAVTWMKSVQTYREACRLDIRAPLAAMLFRDGTLYFMILLVINVLEVVGANVPVMSEVDIVDPFFATVPPLIICRFILNLRQIDVAEGSSVVSTQSHSIRFVGNMGQSLQFGDEGEDGIGDEDAPGSDSDAPSAVAELIVTRAAEHAEMDSLLPVTSHLT